MSASRSQLLHEATSTKDLFMLFLMASSPKFAAVWHLDISTFRVLPKHLFSRTHALQIVTACKAATFCSFTWKEAMATCCSAHRTPLEDYMVSLKRADPEDQVDVQFPMYTLPLEFLICMTKVRPHQELLRDGMLRQFHPSLGNALFVSHQWVSWGHPDPDAEQMKILQDAIANIWSGTVQVSTDPTVEALYGRLSMYSKKRMAAAPLFIWYDYFSVPQFQTSQGLATSLCGNLHEDQRKAIASIPAYILQCEFFVALCPDLRHHDSSSLLNRHSWRRRGWCRSEKMARELSGGNGMILLIESPSHMFLMPAWKAMLDSHGDGEFTVDGDRKAVGDMLKTLVVRKLRTFLRSGDLHSYRFLLNQQHVRFWNSETEPHEGLLREGDCPETKDPPVMSSFFYQNGFVSVADRDHAGWSPLCYAAVRGDTDLMKALLAKKANPDDCIWKGKGDAYLPKHCSVLSLCAYFRCNESMKVLLHARANPNRRDSRKGTALYWANVSDNARGTRLLCEANADPSVQGLVPWNVLETAAGIGATEVVKELLTSSAFDESQFLLHTALMFEGGSPEMISTLIEARCDVNEAFFPTHQAFQMIFLIFSMKHRLLGPSILSTIAYHHRGATPLMLSIISGHFSSAHLLLDAKARIETRNARHRCALDFAENTRAPDILLSELRQLENAQIDEPDDLVSVYF